VLAIVMRGGEQTKGLLKMKTVHLGNHWLSVCPHCDHLIDAPHASKLWDVIKLHFETSPECQKANDALPTLEHLKGIAPDATGDLSSEEFVRRLRNTW